MNNNSQPSSSAAVIRSLRAFAADFIAFSGRRFYGAALLVAAGALFESVGLLLLVPLLALVTRTGGGNGFLERSVAGVFSAFGVATTMGRLAILLAIFVLLLVLRGVVMLRRDIDMQSLQIEFIEDIRARIMRALASAGWDRVLRLRHARIVHVMSGDVQRIAAAVFFMLQSGVSLVLLLFQCALAFWLAPPLALLAIVLLVLGGFALVPILRRAREIGAFVTDANMALVDSTAQFLNGLKLAISQNLQSSYASEFHETLIALRRRQLGYFRQQAGGRVALTTLTALVGAVAVMVGYGVFGIGAPVLIAFLLIVARMSGPAMQLLQGAQQIAFGLPAYEASVALVGELAPLSMPRAAIALPLEDAITIDRISYRHATRDGESGGVVSATLRIAPRTFVGIDGASGAGKTTLIDMLTGLLHPQSGRIAIGPMDLDDRTIGAWRARLSYITQDAFLFHESVRRNLLWARPDATEAEMWDALALAGADAIVRRMQGLDAVVGERGSLVSGGERQRIALARALVRKPRLLILDEATNAIDIPSERALLARLKAVVPPMTIVMVAHRRESLALCDRVLHMENGILNDTEGVRAAVAE